MEWLVVDKNDYWLYSYTLMWVCVENESCLAFPSLQCCSDCCVDDHSRVVLHDTDDITCGYVNANYIDVSA